jgi:cysteine sulfinate desulfinase/cysteine desulfurase-like protein
MGLGDLGTALRLSIGHETGEAEIAVFESALREIASRRRKGTRAA